LKRKLNPVHQAQSEIAASFMPHRRVTLVPAVQRHIELLFRSQKDLCSFLNTTAKTWRDIRSGEGVREATAQGLVIDFISLLRNVSEGEKVDGAKVNVKLVPGLDKRYAPYLLSLNFDKLLEAAGTRPPEESENASPGPAASKKNI
jgi:hypothetical protein